MKECRIEGLPTSSPFPITYYFKKSRFAGLFYMQGKSLPLEGKVGGECRADEGWLRSSVIRHYLCGGIAGEGSASSAKGNFCKKRRKPRNKAKNQTPVFAQKYKSELRKREKNGAKTRKTKIANCQLKICKKPIDKAGAVAYNNTRDSTSGQLAQMVGELRISKIGGTRDVYLYAQGRDQSQVVYH